ncbi:hypothetical protein EJB05_48221, partial [Eragrostis curvula]
MEALRNCSSPCLLTFVLALTCHWCIASSTAASRTFTISNYCAQPIWPATLAGAGTPQLPTTGFRLDPGQSAQVAAPAGWSGRVWARTGCANNGSCQTGDCGGRMECAGTGATPPATLFEITLGKGGDDKDYYDVSLVDGYNLPVVAVPRGGAGGGGGCNATGCMADLNRSCPKELQVSVARAAAAWWRAGALTHTQTHANTGQNPETQNRAYGKDLPGLVAEMRLQKSDAVPLGSPPADGQSTGGGSAAGDSTPPTTTGINGAGSTSQPPPTASNAADGTPPPPPPPTSDNNGAGSVSQPPPTANSGSFGNGMPATPTTDSNGAGGFGQPAPTAYGGAGGSTYQQPWMMPSSASTRRNHIWLLLTAVLSFLM